MHYALTFKDSAGFWILGPVFDDKTIPANMMQVALDSKQLSRDAIAIIARNSIEGLESAITDLNLPLFQA